MKKSAECWFVMRCMASACLSHLFIAERKHLLDAVILAVFDHMWILVLGLLAVCCASVLVHLRFARSKLPAVLTALVDRRKALGFILCDGVNNIHMHD